MSGGHYQYSYTTLNQLADDIESDFLDEGIRYKNDGDHEYDILSDATDEQRVIILNEVKQLIIDIRNWKLDIEERRMV